MAPQPVFALRQSLHMAFHACNVFQFRAFERKQMMFYRLVMFADDVEPSLRQQMMHIRDAARDRIFYRDHRQLGPARVDSLERFFKSEARQRFAIGKNRAARHIRIRAVRALKRYFHQSISF
jgi:hypothetical protein